MNIITTKSFAQHVEDLMSTWHVPGLTIAAFDSERTITKGFGFASLDPDIPATPNTIFDCASTSKSFTAAAVAKLVATGKFNWTTPVSSLLPETFVLPDDRATGQVTIEDILSHRSGMASHDFSYLGIHAVTPDSARSVTSNLRNLPLCAPLRTKFEYCNMLYTVAAHLVEQVSGQPFAQFLQDHFFTPLGMTSTYIQPSSVLAAGPDVQKRFARAYLWQKLDQRFKLMPHDDQPEGLGAGLIQSTVTDYAQWLRAMMTKSPLLFSEDMYDELVTPRIIENPGQSDDDSTPFTSWTTYALGWEVEFYRSTRVVKHNGFDFGFASTMLFLPQQQFGLVIHGNAVDSGEVAQILASELTDEVLQVPAAERVDWAARQLQQTSKDEQKATEALTKMREELSSLSQQEQEQAGQSHREPSISTPSLSAYTGTYHNAGYHSMQVVVKNGSLFIDARDRGMGFTLTFEHIRDGRVFIIHMGVDDAGDTTPHRARFELGSNETYTRMGLELCEELSPELIWFDRTSPA